MKILSLDPETYDKHLIHGGASGGNCTGERVWAETNCYTDLLIELLHASGHEPRAALAFTLGLDFEGDQWTFFKFPHGDLRELFAWDIQELAIWRPLNTHIEEQLSRGRHVLAEVDSYFLPDTAGTAYRRSHVKTTVAVNEIDESAKRLGYFHNQGYFVLDGEDFDGVFNSASAALPPYVEFVKAVPGQPPLAGTALRNASLAQMRRQLASLPLRNPFGAFRERFAVDLEWLVAANNPDSFHAYSFATLRQMGACFELAATYVEWLSEQGCQGFSESSSAFRAISESVKAYQFQLARAVARRKPLDLEPLTAMGLRWSQAMAQLRELAP